MQLFLGSPSIHVVDIRMVHGKRPNYDRYIGRAVKGTEFTEDSIYANPYRIDEYGERAIPLYEAYIIEKIETKPHIYDLSQLVGQALGCWCITTYKIYPTICHGQILMKLVKQYLSKK